MRTLAIAAGCIFGAVAASAFAQYPRYYDPYATAPRYAPAGEECWNPHAGHFERVRPGEVQNDLDFAHCRPAGYGYRHRYAPPPQAYGETREECWNPHAGHYEGVRPGEVQNDLDYSHCRVYRY